MNYQITSDNIDMSPSMENLVREKFGRLESHIRKPDLEVSSVRVVLNKASGVDKDFTVKAVVKLPKKEYFSDETSYSLEHAVVKTVEELDRMMRKGKGEY
jgi:ribosomal subunit interface protein